MRTIIAILFLFFISSSLVAQVDLDRFFNQADAFFMTYVQNGRVNYAGIQQNDATLRQLTAQLAEIPLKGMDDDTRLAHLINAYNLLVIQQVVDNYPLASPLDKAGFFDREMFVVAGQPLTLNDLEKDVILKRYPDPRLHFALVCGAVGCPPIINQAYRAASLDRQLETQTRAALNDPTFVRINGEQVELSQIFEWYADDFGGNTSAAVAFINRYRSTVLPTGRVSFYTYDWALNEQMVKTENTNATSSDFDVASNNAARYVVSATIPVGTFEIKGFANLYTQETGSTEVGEPTDRATFFTQNLSVLYGVHPRLNVGFDLKYRQVSFGPVTDSRFAVFNFEQDPSNWQSLTGYGPKIRYAPSTALPNFSIQSTYWISTDRNRNVFEGVSGERPFIDWNNDVWFTQIFNDFSLGDNFSVFAELDILWEDIGRSEDGAFNRFSTPVQGIFSYFPNPQTTIYALGAYSPYWQQDYDYFYQGGFGAKYQFTPQVELELLYTQFRNSFIRSTNGKASTLNLGLRISVF